MSIETYPVEVSPEQLERFSTSALLVVQARLRMGNGTAYDDALCRFVGDAQDAFHPIDQVAPSGRTYSYNGKIGGLVQSGFTESGTLVNVRHAEGWKPAWEPGDTEAMKQYLRPPEDNLSEFFVASVDLRNWDRTKAITEWHIVGIERYGLWRKENVKIHLYNRPALASLDGPAESSNPMDALITRRSRVIPEVTAQLTLDTSRGLLFKQDGKAEEPLMGAEVLIAEVNELSELYGLTGEKLDEVREQYEKNARDLGRAVSQLPRSA